MNNIKKWTVAGGVMLLMLVSFSCERDVEDSNVIDENSEFIEDTTEYTWDSLTVTTIELLGNDVSIIGSGASYSGSQVTITEGGDYLVNGTLSSGNLKVAAEETSEVKIFLSNASITSNNNACIYVESASKAIIVLNEGTQNSLIDSYSYTDEDQNAALFSKTDLVLSGEGTLTVDANYNDAITSKDGLIIQSGNYVITSVDDGIRGKDYLAIQAGTFTINSSGDALKSDNEDLGYGMIAITNGEFNITASADGISAENELTIETGTFNLKCTYNASSAKALKAGSLVEINGGDFILSAVDDAVHSNENIEVNGGTFAISTQDDGFHADADLTITYADITISNSYEGLEAENILIADGMFDITASDDGINGPSGGGGFGGGSSSGSCTFVLNGGFVAVNAGGDGVDIGGTTEMNAGTLLIHGPTNSANGAIDCDRGFYMDGGLMVAAGSSGMAESPESSSDQYSVMVYFSSSQQAGKLISIIDADDNEVITFKSDKVFTSVVLSSSELISGNTYSIYTGGSYSGNITNGLCSGGEYTPGTLYSTVTISSKVTTVGSGGSTGPGGRP